MSDQPGYGAGSPEAARNEIERTRARMSETLDEIEEVLIRKKENFRDKMDIGARLREKPLVTAGVVLGAGVLLGFLTGGKDKEGEAERIAAQARAALWEERARRLLAIAREQEEDLDDLENQVLDAAAPPPGPSRWRYSAPPSAFALSSELEDIDDEDDEELDDEMYDEEYEDDDDEDEDDDDDDEPSRVSELKDEIISRAGEFISNFSQALIEGARKRL